MSSINYVVRSEDKPLGGPRQILTVFREDGNSYVKFNMARDYKRSQDGRVHEYLPFTFEVGEFRQRFSKSEHGEVMEELNKKVAELNKDKSEVKSAMTIWLEWFSGWLQPILGCLPLESGTRPADGLQED
ncbi:hypothetical protein ST47_g9903 [Ascochyta rabiei]|uniref:Uncharacterized protein n=1 Tax=Didymella rabiei TaxID=5454 RepID=A0A162WCU0_DIDRA|nr:hypothetical protein ST47_g9903 [Ascochyta rabiei]